MDRIKFVLRDTRGATAIEYAMIASLIAVAGIAGFQALGTKQGAQYNNVNNRL